ncbi:MAG TPA: SPFH domain-containing protein [Capsulimonadaceae bacterium]|jgi:hypothetical protein
MIRFFKGQPSDFIIHYRSGKLARSGQGIAFLYLPFDTQIVTIPVTSRDTSFIFNETTNNFQSVTIQGQCTYRVSDPKTAAGLLNFTIDLRTRRYVSDDPERLAQRITNVIQMQTRAEIQSRSLENTLQDSEAIASAVFATIQKDGLLARSGVELLSIYFISAKPTPEVSKALEAEYRETLLRKADEAVYARRASAVEEERKIKERQLSSDVALEEQRRQLIDLQGENAQQEAEYRGKALDIESEYQASALQKQLAVYDSRDPKLLLALALKEMGANAERVGNLTITSEILASLLNDKTSQK